MSFYQEIITQKSWQILKILKQKFNFVLIGGWAIWLLTQALKSKDIDIIVNYDTLALLKKEFDIVKNDRLKKYEAKAQEVDIDIYLPYYSNPGIPAEIIQNYVFLKEGFQIPKPEVLLILKQMVYEKRKASIKGQKDKLDILTLLTLDLDFSFYKKILQETRQTELSSKLENLLKSMVRVKELNFSNYRLAKLKDRVLKQIY